MSAAAESRAVDHREGRELGRGTVLVVEDDRAQMQALTVGLEGRGYVVHGVASGAEAVDSLARTPFDVVLLDMGLPDVDGLTLCTRIRDWTRCPIIVVSADAVEDRIVGALEAGADDYVIKPYSMGVLAARIRVALRHAATAAAVVNSPFLVVGDTRLDLDAYQVSVDGATVDMSRQQFEMLAVLARNVDKIVTYRALARALWGYEPETIDLNALRIGVSRVRQRLGAGPNRPVINNERAIGYRLVVPDPS